jgi:hypothetical protein
VRADVVTAAILSHGNLRCARLCVAWWRSSSAPYDPTVRVDDPRRRLRCAPQLAELGSGVLDARAQAERLVRVVADVQRRGAVAQGDNGVELLARRAEPPRCVLQRRQRMVVEGCSTSGAEVICDGRGVAPELDDPRRDPGAAEVGPRRPQLVVVRRLRPVVAQGQRRLRSCSTGSTSIR